MINTISKVEYSCEIIYAKKDGEFAGTCASQNPMINTNGEACGFCGKTPDQFDTCTEPQHKS